PRSQRQQDFRSAKSRRLALPAADNYQRNPADQTNPARDGRKGDPVAFLVSDLNGPVLRVFLFLPPTHTAPSESDDAEDNKDNADNDGRFHWCELTMVGDLGSN